MARAGAAPLLWRYTLRWGLRHLPCPGALELAASEVSAGALCPAAVAALWKPGAGYFITLDFQQPAGAVRRWSDERRANARRRSLAARIEKAAPLFADELIARELEERRDYFNGYRIDAESD